VLDGARLHVSNLGDSRAYAIRGRDRPEDPPHGRRAGGTPTGGDDIKLLTKDHSVAAALMDQGQLTPEQARMHPLRNHLTASLGIPQPVTPAYVSVAVQPGDRIVLCSDGLWDMLSDAEIADLSIAHSDPREAVKALISAANAAGGLDNITVIVVAVGAEETAGQEQVTAETMVETAEPALATEPCMSGQPVPSPPRQGGAQ
jgi:protein phosphatase